MRVERVFRCFIIVGLMVQFFPSYAEESYIRKIAQEKAGSLFSVSKDGVQVGWIYGSMHIGTPEKPSIGKNVLDVLDSAEVVFFESNNEYSSWVDIDEPELDNGALVKILTERKVTKDLTAERKRVTKKAVDPARLMNQFAYAGVATPSLVAQYRDCGYFIEFGTESQVSLYLTGKKREVYGLEESQQATEAITSAIRQNKNDKRVSKKTGSNELSFCEDLSLKHEQWSRGYDKSTNENTNIGSILLNSNMVRNEAMLKTIEKASLNGKRNFFMPGDAHLWGDSGIIEKLRQRGFILQRI